MLLEVVRLEKLDALLRDLLTQLLQRVVLQISYEEQIDNCAGAVAWDGVWVLESALVDGDLFLVLLPERLIRIVSVAAFVTVIVLQHEIANKHFKVCLGKIEYALFPAVEQLVCLIEKLSDHRLCHAFLLVGFPFRV